MNEDYPTLSLACVCYWIRYW